MQRTAPKKQCSRKIGEIVYSLKGQCHEIFCFWFFSWISFPQASDYTIRAVLNFFENSRRYSQLKVCHQCQRHRWQMEKIFNHKNFNNFIWSPLFGHKNFNNFIWSPLGSRGNIYINFCLQVHFQVSAVWYCSNMLPPVSLIPVAICHRHRYYQGLGGRWFMKKTWSKKSRDTVPLKLPPGAGS